MESKSKDHPFQETSSGFEEQVHTSQLTHLTKARPKPLNRTNKRARSTSKEESSKENEGHRFQTTSSSKSQTSPIRKPPRPTAPKSPKIESTFLPSADSKTPPKSPKPPRPPAPAAHATPPKSPKPPRPPAPAAHATPPKSPKPSRPAPPKSPIIESPAVSLKPTKPAGIKESSFRLPGLDEMKGKSLRKTTNNEEKRPENDLSTLQIKTKQHDPVSIVPGDNVGQTTIGKTENQQQEKDDITIDSKHNLKESNPLANEISLKGYDDNEKSTKSHGDLSDEKPKNDRQPLIDEKNPGNQNAWSRRGGSMRLSGSTSASTNNFGHRNTRRSFSTGRDVKSIRERLESGSNTLRSSLSRFGSTVSLKAQPNKTSKKTPKGEKERLIFEEDPDENTDKTLRKKHEEKEQAELAKNKLVPSTPKGKRRLIGGQSGNITSSEKTKPVVIPTYKKLQTFDNENVNDDYHSPTSTPNFVEVSIKKEPTATYKKLSSSPTMQPKVTPIESRRRNHENETTTKNEARVPPVETTEHVIKRREVDVIMDNNNTEEDQIVNQNKSTDHNPVQPQTVDRFASKQDNNTLKGDPLPKYRNNNRQKSSFSPLARSFTWNSSKKVKSQQQQQKDNGVVENSHAVEGENELDSSMSSPPPIRRSYSSRHKPRRKLDDQGRLLDSKGCAKRNILSSLSFLSGRKSEPKRMLKEEEENDEEDFSKINTKKEPQQSNGSGKSGLFENSPSTPQQTWENKQSHTDDDRQLLIEDDDDSDEDSCLDRTIQNNNKNNMKARQRDNGKKNSKSKLGGLSLKKNYNL